MSLSNNIIKNIELTSEQMFKTSTVSAMLTQIAPLYEYQNGAKTNNVIGTRYTCVFPMYAYEKASVKVIGDLAPNITPEMLVQSPIPVKITGLKGKIYTTQNHSIEISLSAGKIEKEVSNNGK